MLQMYVSDVIRGMLKVFHIDVAKVGQDVAYVESVLEAYGKCFRGMLQVVLEPFCKRLKKYFICFIRMLQAFFIRMLHMFHTYVARVCS